MRKLKNGFNIKTKDIGYIIGVLAVARGLTKDLALFIFPNDRVVQLNTMLPLYSLSIQTKFEKWFYIKLYTKIVDKCKDILKNDYS